MKSEPYEALLRLTKAELKELFPFGASSTGKDRWEPAEKGKANKTLAKLLKDKKDRIETVRLLHRDSTRGYTDNPALSMRPDVGQAVDKETQERFSKEGRERHLGRSEGKPLWEMLRELEESGLSERQKQSIRRRVEAARRAGNKYAA